MGREGHDVQIDDWYKGGVEDGPDDVEFPLQRLDADGSDLDNHDWVPIRAFHPISTQDERFLQLKAQLDAVPSAAPLVLMLKLLISVGYSHGTPCHPIPKKT